MSPPVEVNLRQSCPSGFTEADLAYIFDPGTLQEFKKWMNGQTMMLCNGMQFHWTRAHDETCMNMTTTRSGKGHKEGDPYDWSCKYLEGGWYETTSCASPGYAEGIRVDRDTTLTGHGLITYRHDVERFIKGGMAKDMWD